MALTLAPVLAGRAAVAPYCDPTKYVDVTCESCPEWGANRSCLWGAWYYCVTGELLDKSNGGVLCDPATFVPYTTKDRCSHPDQGNEICGDKKDNNWDGCADEGCIEGTPPCTCTTSCATKSCSAAPLATCDPQDLDADEICGNGEDDNCDGDVDEGCEPEPEPPPAPDPVPPPPPPDPKCCGCKGGADPILLADRRAVTIPFTDFSASAVVALGISRTWNSLDSSHLGGDVGVFGRGWHHQWEATLTCSGGVCTVARGAGVGSRFQIAESALSLDGTESWQLYRPIPSAKKTGRRELLARRPAGEWILFEPDGRTLHFATACDACAAADRFCTAPEAGGAARLVKVVDPRGNAIHLGYSKPSGTLLALTDDLGHSLELRSSTACVDGLGRELYYDGLRVVTYAYQGWDLASATDSDGAVLRAYSYDLEGAGFLLAVHDESGSPIVEFSYDTKGDAVGIVDESTTMVIAYAQDGTVSVSESYGLNVSAGQRRFDPKGNLTSVSEGCSCGGSKTLSYLAGDLSCSQDASGTWDYYGRDAVGRVTRHARYSGQACPPSNNLVGAAFEEEWRTYGVVKQIAQGVSLELDHVTSVSRPSASTSSNRATESWDYDPAPKSYDPVGYSCAEAPLPAGAVVCRHLSTGYVTVSGATVTERHATFYAYDGRGRVTEVIGPINLDRPAASDVTPVEARIYWGNGETLARRGRLAEVRRYPLPTAAPLATTFDYDLFGLYRSWQPDGTFTTWLKDGRGRTRFAVESDGRSSETRYHDGEKPRIRIGPDGVVERTGYDSRGRVTSQERLSSDPDVAGANVSVLSGEYHQYDPAGNRIHSERRDETGTAVWKQDRDFDVQHRLVNEAHPDQPSAARSWTYDSSGFLTKSSDEEGRGTSFLPEYIGRVKSVTRSGFDAAGASVSQTMATYTYQSNTGRLSRIVDAKGKLLDYRYDDFGRLEQLLGSSTFRTGGQGFSWDARGNLLQRNDLMKYATVANTYDGLDRVLTSAITYTTDGTSLTYRFGYDENG